MRRLAVAALIPAPVVSAAQVVVPGRPVLPPPAVAAVAAAATVPQVEAAEVLVTRVLATSRASPMARTPWHYGRCTFVVQLPDSLGLAAAPAWAPTPLVALPAVVPARVVGALCGDTTERSPFVAQLHAVVERDEHFGLVALRDAAPPAAEYMAVRTGRAWAVGVVLHGDPGPYRFVDRSLCD